MPRENQSWLEKSRERLRATNVMEKLAAHVNGEHPMTKTQVTAGIALLKKIMPDLTSVEMSGNVEHRNVVSSEPLTEQQWAEQNSTH